MAIKKICFNNFKSFKKLELELKDFNVLIGANASGKSNFIEIFKFLRDIANFGLDNAISLQGAVDFFRNTNLSNTENFSLEVIFDHSISLHYGEKMKIKIYEENYKFEIKFNNGNKDFEIVKDQMTLFFELLKMEDYETDKILENFGRGKIVISKVMEEIKINYELPEKSPLKEDDIYLPLFFEREYRKRSILLETPYLLYLSPLPSSIPFKYISVYDFDPKLQKETSSISGKRDLDENGKNLAIVLKRILDDKKEKKKFKNLVKDLLPFIEDVDVERFADKNIFFKLKERYNKTFYYPASLISDGTINIITLIIALFFEDKEIIIIEEPERNIHPSLLSGIVNYMKEASEISKQIIVTTHNPELVKYAGLENLLLINRDKQGFSQIIRPAEKEEVKKFLESDLGIDELYVRNLLD